MTKQKEFVSEDETFGFGGGMDIGAIDLDKIRIFVERLAGMVKFEASRRDPLQAPDEKDGDVLSLFTHALFQLQPGIKETLDWTEGFDELYYRQLLDVVSATLLVQVSFTLDKDDSWERNRSYYLPKFVYAIGVLNAYLKKRGAGVDDPYLPTPALIAHHISTGVWKDYQLKQFKQWCDRLEINDPLNKK
jgi:hypothetical protein